MFYKKCIPDKVEKDEEPLDACELEKKKRELAKKKKKKCVKKPICPPPPEPEKSICEGRSKEPPCLCLEKIKNPPIDPSAFRDEQAILDALRFTCMVKPQLPGQDRCDKIRDLENNHPDKSKPNCEPPPPPPPPPKLDPCEEQDRRAKIAECKARMKRYLE
ncbi:transmembrane cell adhesion receptor mua-3-like [Spodoptera litura]|uniref:Transmembrane cell adhesion receptor mua-3-like n=1 Tax=Spodoptera litura TaxID=69820 RepID=A0A9J7J600_SPOLT|nr:transmembrane cell adhesion receptor mua-3-like [Spodoptera litura]